MKDNKLITILTPAYNRIDKLNNLYNSLCKQTSLNFIWLIIDDGSTENLKEKIDSFHNNNFKIVYKYKTNGGKHSAINYGLKIINTKLVFIVDNDDWLTNNAIEIIGKYYDEYNKNDNICGFSFLRQYPNGKTNVNLNNSEDIIGSYIQMRVNNNKVGDMAEVYFTSILKQYSFPEIENENFFSEDYVWIEIAKKYDLVFSSKVIYISDYIDDGLTKNRRKNNFRNPNGCYIRALVFIDKKINLKNRFKGMILCQVYGWFLKKKAKEIYNDTKHIALYILSLPFSFFIKKVWIKQYIEVQNEKNN